MRVLLTGGAGYVGSACFRFLRRQGVEAFVLDDLSEGHVAAIDESRIDVADLRDTDATARILRNRRIDHVLHFAARTSIPNSIRDPSGYWSVNVDGSRSLLEAMRAVGISWIVFSSTAAVYAHGVNRPIREEDSILPATPYGMSKLAVEHLLQGYSAAYGFGATALRYFNASGAEVGGRHGEAHREETHVIPLIMQAALGQRKEFNIYGNDWETPDGTCIRDYISIQDLASAHFVALRNLQRGRMSCYNIGSGVGTSVLELLTVAEHVTQRSISCTFEEKRPGDPPVLLADITRAKAELGWCPQRSHIRDVVESAWQWHTLGGSYASKESHHSVSVA